ncbi:1,4-dihydroxy-2-naphthoate octaprenyltransferase [uncultured Alistipes sp.]|uniref:1,4-dihydroxy-2-naphthoate octaprenyltransferase n=1 Tax=uncultured Alistipes sp. TaxID=538949 RepID=UPI00272CB5AF|nr:1,4-dihydroxy-2-naphthoate octaprenyltransferase [uncultured Alistipes sp.]
MKTNSFAAWVLAVRPYSLGAAIIPVAVGSALAWSDGGFNLVVTLLCACFAILAQCTANLVNDLWDFLRGADQPDRLGPDRAFAKGYITLPAMKAGIGLFTLATALAGCGLLFYGGWQLIPVGAVCLLFAYIYTAGPWPLAYHGLGDAAVVTFFGLVPACFTYYIQTGGWNWQVTAAALACGLVIDTMLWINNFRDREEDARCGKKTLVVYWGERVGRWGYLVLGTVAVALCVSLWIFSGRMWAGLLPLLYLPLLLATWRKIIRIDHGDELNACLGETARNMQLFGLLLTIGILLG